MESSIKQFRRSSCWMEADIPSKRRFCQVLPELSPPAGDDRPSNKRVTDIPQIFQNRPFTFEQSADNKAVLLRYLHVEHADLFGFSSGGTIAFEAAIRRLHLVQKLVIASDFSDAMMAPILLE